jgi:hypothetical protein
VRMMISVVLQARVLPFEFLLTEGLLTRIGLLCVTMLLPSVSSKIALPILSNIRIAAI